jgi:hypothetical protein
MQDQKCKQSVKEFSMQHSYAVMVEQIAKPILRHIWTRYADKSQNQQNNTVK